MPFGPPVKRELRQLGARGGERGRGGRGRGRTPHGEGAAGQEARDDGVVRVLLLPVALDGAVERREEAAPDTKVAADDGRARLDGRQRAEEAVAAGRVARAFDAVPDGAAYCTHGAASGRRCEAGSARVPETPSARRGCPRRGRETHKAPPKSLRMTQGLSWSHTVARGVVECELTRAMRAGSERGRRRRVSSAHGLRAGT